MLKATELLLVCRYWEQTVFLHFFTLLVILHRGQSYPPDIAPLPGIILNGCVCSVVDGRLLTDILASHEMPQRPSSAEARHVITQPRLLIGGASGSFSVQQSWISGNFVMSYFVRSVHKFYAVFFFATLMILFCHLGGSDTSCLYVDTSAFCGPLKLQYCKQWFWC